MASAALNAVAHSAPNPYAIPLGPRVRPPRLLPGTKADNTNPQPPGPIPDNSVWVQGKWRNPASNAAKDRQSLESKQVEKALRHHTHGMNIYAYRQIRTNQVVYSLTRVMQNNKILPQLVFHRKKTVPASLRRDVWRPYFSIHFPQTTAGAHAGLRAYQYLRELALKRQLDPPAGMLMATEEDVEKAKQRHNPISLRDKLKNHDLRDLPRLNQLLPAKWRAKKLMDHTQTSVADTAFVLSVLNLEESPTERLARIEEQRIRRHKARTPRDRRRINEIRQHEEQTAEKIESRQQMLQPQPGQKGLDRHAAERIAIEYGGAVVGDGSVGSLQDIQVAEAKTAESKVPSVKVALRAALPVPFDADKYRAEFTEKWEQKYYGLKKPAFPTEQMEAEVKEQEMQFAKLEASQKDREADIKKLVKADKEQQANASRKVFVSWADQRDATYAESWPKGVYHSWVEPKAVVKRQVSVIRQQAMVDEDGQEVSEQKQDVLVQNSTSPHVFGRDEDEGWFKPAHKQDEEMKEMIKPRLTNWEQSRREAVIKRMLELRPPTKLKINPLDRQRIASDVRDDKLEQLYARYPEYKRWLDEFDNFSGLVTELEALRIKEEEVPEGESKEDLINEREVLEAEARTWDGAYPGFLKVETKRQQLAAEFRSQIALHERSQHDEEVGKLELEVIRERITEIRAEYADVVAEIIELKVDATLSNHHNELRSKNDDTYENAALTTRSAALELQMRKAPEIDKAELAEQGVHVDQTKPRRGVWGRVKGIFGR